MFVSARTTAKTFPGKRQSAQAWTPDRGSEISQGRGPSLGLQMALPSGLGLQSATGSDFYFSVLLFHCWEELLGGGKGRSSA